MSYLNTKKAYKIACRLAKENIGRADFPYIEKSRLINALKAEPGMVRWSKGELHPYAGPSKQIDWDKSLESMVKQYNIKGIRPRGYSEEIFIPLPED